MKMDEEEKCCKGFSVEETEDGYIIHIKGDKSPLKAKMEALEAYWNFRQKAKEAGFGPRHHHSHNRGFMSLLQKHMEEFSCWDKEDKEE
jgi:hypothetical protein